MQLHLQRDMSDVRVAVMLDTNLPSHFWLEVQADCSPVGRWLVRLSERRLEKKVRPIILSHQGILT